MMAFRKILSNSKRLFKPINLNTSLSPTKREYLTSSTESLKKGFLSLPIRVFSSPPPPLPPCREAGEIDGFGGVSVEDARKLLRVAQVEMMKGKVRKLGKVSVSYWEFVRICRECCGLGSEGQAIEFADFMDRSGHVIVFGHVVFLRPEQVAKSMENFISQSIATPNDPRREQLKQMEREMSIIDQKARTQVRRELCCGLGFLIAQTLGFMRLTFWELNWDVMEPICFFVTSIHFALAYGFFLWTSTEPSFEGYFYRRFRAKQKKIMKAHNFDLERYNELRKVFYPSLGYCETIFRTI